jgi:hypothetical protein
VAWNGDCSQCGWFDLVSAVVAIGVEYFIFNGSKSEFILDGFVSSLNHTLFK